MIWMLFSLAHADVPSDYQASYDAEARGDFNGALAALQRMPGAEQQTYVHVLRKAWLLYLKADYAGAQKAYDAAIAAESGAIEPKLGKLLPLLADRRYKAADNLATQVLEAAPSNTTARSRRAWARYNLGRYAEAEADYQAVLKAFPSDIEMMAGIGWCKKLQGDAAGARTWFERVLHVAPNHASARAGIQ